MGDTGAYVLGFFYGYLLIKIYSEYQIFSPFFVILLLWYPCFENLFSIIRKFQLKKSPIKPDNNHLHQLIYFYLKKKYKVNNLFANNYGSLIILLYNLIVFWYWNTKHFKYSTSNYFTYSEFICLLCGIF